MRRRKARLGLMVAMAFSLVLLMASQNAFADYAPSLSDVVGVGSDTVQNIIGFLADGFPSGDTGYNAIGNLNKLINFDATADGNVRLSYGPDGLGTGQCSPGTGTNKGTGNDTTTHANKPCVQNPTIILRAGLPPMQRPNGSGAGYDALLRDTHHWIDFSRSSTCQGSGTGCRGKVTAGIDSVQMATDPLSMLQLSTGSNAVPLSAAQLKSIYEAHSPTCKKWTDVGGASTNTIIPVLPQFGSGTRASFLAGIGTTEGALGDCTFTSEENDPTAIFDFGSPADTIAPVSGGRVNLFNGKLGDGVTSNGFGLYFNDPSCDVESTTSPCTSPSPNAPGLAGISENPINVGAGSRAVKFTTGSPSDSNPLFLINRPLYVYFRDSDVGNTSPYGADHPFQPGGTLNWVRTLFYNPCSGRSFGGPTGCVHGTGINSGFDFGPGGAPYIFTSAGRALINDAGLTPTYAFTANGP